MKRNLNNFIAVAVVASVFVACAKETEHTAPTIKPSTDSKGIEINVVALETKTAVVDGTTPSVKWLSTDAVKVFEIVDDAVFGNATSSETTLSDGDAIASFKATLPGEPSAGDHTYKYTSVYPASAVKEDGGHYYLEVPATQNLVDGNFATDADVLISSVVNKGSTRVTASENVGFAFGRLGTVVKLTLKGITPGEKIQRVVITAPVDIAGSIQYDPITGTVDTNTLYDDESSDTITLNVDNLVATGTDVLWFRVLSQSWDEGDEFSVVVTTNKAKYYRDEWGNWDKITIPTGGFAFADGGLTKLGINLANYRVAHYVAAVAGDIVDGATFVVGGYKSSDPSQYYVLSAYSSSIYTAAKAEMEATKLCVPTNLALTITLENAGGGKYYLKDSENYYLNYSGSSNNISRNASKSDADAYKWEVTTTSCTPQSATSRVLQFNPGSPRFVCYSSGNQTAIQLYKLDGPSVSGSAVSFDSAVSATKSSTLTPINLTNISERSWTDKPAWVTVTFDGNTMNVTATDNKTLEARDGVIRVSVTGEEGTAGCDVAVSQPASVFTASSTADMNFAWDDNTVEAQTIIIASTFAVTTGDNVEVTGANAAKFSATLDASGTPGEYILSVKPIEANTSGANYIATVSVSRDELTPFSINVKQAAYGAGPEPLSTPGSVTAVISAIDLEVSWADVENAIGYEWVISTSATADGVVKSGDGVNVPSGGYGSFTVASPGSGVTHAAATWTMAKEVTLVGGTTYYFYVKANGTGDYADSDYASVAKKALYVTKLTNAQIVSAGSGASSYTSWNLTGDNDYVYSAYAIKNQHSKATSAYHFLQIKGYSNSTAYYIQLPAIGTKINKIIMTVSASNKPMTDGANSATCFFSSSNSTSTTGTGVVSGTGASRITLNAGSLNLNTGYITAGGAIRIWDLTIYYENES